MRRTWAVGAFAAGVALLVAVPPDRAGGAPVPKPAKVGEVAERWLPAVEGAKVAKFGSVLANDGKARVAAHTFDVTGATFAEVWDFYAAKCGTKTRYADRAFPQEVWTGGKGPSYAVQDRHVDAAAPRPGPANHFTTFNYRAAGLTVAVTLRPNADGTVSGALTVVLDE